MLQGSIFKILHTKRLFFFFLQHEQLDLCYRSSLLKVALQQQYSGKERKMDIEYSLI